MHILEWHIYSDKRIAWYLPKGYEKSCIYNYSKNVCLPVTMYMNIHNTYDYQNLDTNKLSFHKWLDKQQIVVETYN